MKINFKFDSLSREEKIELTKEVLTSQDEDVKRLIASKKERNVKIAISQKLMNALWILQKLLIIID